MSKGKYHNEKYNGYASKREAARAAELHLLERAGKIRNLREQVKYELVPSIFEHPDGSLIVNTEENQVPQYKRIKLGLSCVERPVAYVADFVYEDEAGKTIVEDTKGVRTPEYIIKRKLMLWLKGIRIREI